MIYTRCLQQHDKADTCGPEGQAFLVDRCCETYASVADWEGLQQWLQDLKVRLHSLRHSAFQEHQLQQQLYCETGPLVYDLMW